MTRVEAGLCGAGDVDAGLASESLHQELLVQLGTACLELPPACPVARRLLEGLSGPHGLSGDVQGTQAKTRLRDSGTPAVSSLLEAPEQVSLIPRSQPRPGQPSTGPGATPGKPWRWGLGDVVTTLRLSGEACLMGQPCPHLSAPSLGSR